MKDQRSFAAGIGFAFVAAWIAFGFGDAVLCLVGAAVFWTVAGVLGGNVDLGELQGRLTGNREDDLSPPPASPRAPFPKPSRRSRVR
jgi:hypothetical protein